MGKELVNVDGLDKEITQGEKIEPVSKALADMGAIWRLITTKLDKDRTCYVCKKELGEKEKCDIIKVPDKNIDKGLIAFVAVCKPCNSE